MRKNRFYIGLVAMVALLVASSCSSKRYTRDAAYRDRGVYQSPDYYYTEGNVTGNEYYAEEHVDEAPRGGEYQDDFGDLEYANRINRFYYATPGMAYYDPWFDPWFGYAGFGLGGWNMGFGWGSPWGWNMGFGWGSPWGMNRWNMGFGWGWNSWAYSPYSMWGHPYYGGWGMGGRHFYHNPVIVNRNRYASSPRVSSGRHNVDTRNSLRAGGSGRASSGSITRDASGRILNGTTAGRISRGSDNVGTRGSATRTAVGSSRSSRDTRGSSGVATGRNPREGAVDRGTVSGASRGGVSRESAPRSQGGTVGSGRSSTPRSGGEASRGSTPSRGSAPAPSTSRGSSGSSRPSSGSSGSSMSRGSSGSSGGGMSRGSSGGSSRGGGGGASSSRGGSSRGR